MTNDKTREDEWETYRKEVIEFGSEGNWLDDARNAFDYAYNLRQSAIDKAVEALEELTGADEAEENRRVEALRGLKGNTQERPNP